MKSRLALCFVPLFASGVLFAGCKEDPPAPPPPGAAGSASAAAQGKAKGAEPTTQVPAFSDETTKRFRTELCFYGAYGLKLARDTYLASLKGATPGEGKIPSFELPEPSEATPAPPAGAAATGVPAAGAATAKPAAGAATAVPAARAAKEKPAAGAATAVASGAPAAPAATEKVAARPATGALGQRLPFTRFLSSCSLAAKGEPGATPKPEDAAIDKALADFEPFATTLNRQLMAAQRYYASKQYESDKFERSKTMHEGLVKSFGELDQKLEAFRAAFEAAQGGWGKSPEKLDKAGDLAGEAVGKARRATNLLLADAADGEAVKKATDELVAARDALAAAGNEDGKAVHPRAVGPRLGKLAELLGEAQRTLKDKKVPMANVYAVTAEMALLVEANYRAVGQVLRATGQTKAGGPLRMLSPRIDAVRGGAPKRVRPESKPGTERPNEGDDHDADHE